MLIRTVFIGIWLLLAQAAVHAQPVLHEHDGHKGTALSVGGSLARQNAMNGLGARASSLRVPDGWSLLVFDEEWFLGNERWFPKQSDAEDLKQIRRGSDADSHWGDAIRSAIAFQNGMLRDARASSKDEAGKGRGLAWSKAYYTLGSEEAAVVQAPELAGRTVTFVDAIHYEAACDDEFSFRVTPLEHESIAADSIYVAHAAQGDDKSRFGFALNTWALPNHVKMSERRILRLKSKQGQTWDNASFEVRPGTKSLVIVEVLKYWAGGDDDMSYAVGTWQKNGRAGAVAVMDGGSKDSEVVIRVTHLYWRLRLHAQPTHDPRPFVPHERMIVRGNTTSVATKAPGMSFLVTPMAYLADGVRFNPEFLDTRLLDMYRADFSGDGHDDDDFSVKLLVQPGRVSATITDGNPQSAAVFRLIEPDFTR